MRFNYRNFFFLFTAIFSQFHQIPPSKQPHQQFYDFIIFDKGDNAPVCVRSRTGRMLPIDPGHGRDSEFQQKALVQAIILTP